MPSSSARQNGKATGLPDQLLGPVYASVSPLRAAEILAFGALTTTQLSIALRCHQRTARRTLNRLVDEGWAVRAGGAPPRYKLTLRAVAMAAQALSRSPFGRIAVALVDEVFKRLERPAYMAVPCYDQVLCLTSSGPSPVR